MISQFPPDVAEAIQARLASGEYASEEDVLRDALKALSDRKYVVIDEDPVVIEGVRRGLADAEAGRMRSLEEFDLEFRRQHGISADC